MSNALPIGSTAPSRVGVAVAALARELAALVEALASPNTIIAEVEQMQALLRQANDVESIDPTCAAELRARASKVGLA